MGMEQKVKKFIFYFNIYIIKNNISTMSKPYINVTSVTYASPTLSVSYEYTRLRGVSSFTIDGFSNSATVTPSGLFSTGTTDNINFGPLGTSSADTYVGPTISFVLSGTPSATNSNIKISFGGTQFINATSSTASLAGFASQIGTTFSSNSNVSLSVSGNILTFTGQYGNQYNGSTMSINVTNGSGISLASTPTLGTFSGGTTTYNLTVNNPRGGYIDTIAKTSTTGTSLS